MCSTARPTGRVTAAKSMYLASIASTVQGTAWCCEIVWGRGGVIVMVFVLKVSFEQHNISLSMPCFSGSNSSQERQVP